MSIKVLAKCIINEMPPYDESQMNKGFFSYRLVRV